MKFGIIKNDIDVEYATAQNIFGNYTKGAIVREGKRLLRQYPSYKYLRNDPKLECDNDFYSSVVYAYLADQIMIDNPELKETYNEIKVDRMNDFKCTEQAYYTFNLFFVCWYHDYLREQADPGCIEQERKEAERKQQALKDAKMMQEMHERIKTQQDLTSGKRVVCPYCKSTNTEKISTVSRAVSVSLVGAAGGKLGKQWRCKNCSSNF